MPPEGESELLARRRAALARLREGASGASAFPNDFRRTALARELHERFAGQDQASLQARDHQVRIAGRMMRRRIMGKASFAHLQDMSGDIQIYARREGLPEGVYRDFKQWDLGDIIAVEGQIMRTRKGELSVQAHTLRLLCKSLRPLPEKFHGLSDRDARYRQRYLDLLSNAGTRKVFADRSRIIAWLRDFLLGRGFVEVETPMMHPLPGGAAARPFITHHNSLDRDLYLRIAPELYLKRLVVGGMEQVFEINRSFRNEGLSPQHNPEFTMLEFYQAYTDHRGLMQLTEQMLCELVSGMKGGPALEYQGQRYDFTPPLPRLGLREALAQYQPGLSAAELDDPEQLRALAGDLDIPLRDEYGTGKLQLEIFEKTVQGRLQQPVFITDYPTEVSPLARRQDQHPERAERFELFAAGQEIANGFSELNDPEEQAERLRRQAGGEAGGKAGGKAGGEEAMHYDEDYITALEHGLPPTAGEGIGIDRLVMLLTDSPSIRDVILFPQLRSRSP